MNDDTRKQYKAEARFLRAFYYFTLVECWGDVPFKTTSTEDAYNLSIPRTDKQTIYDFIIKEMYGSAEDLKSAQDLNYYRDVFPIGCLGNVGACIYVPGR